MKSIKTLAKLSFLSAAVSGFVVFSVHAEQGGKHQPIAFSDFDLDGSGLVSEEEFNAVRGERMAAKAAEGKQMRGAASAPSFADVDTSGDGSISAEELTAAQTAHREKRQNMKKGHGQGHGNGDGQGHGKTYGHGKGKGGDCSASNKPCGSKKGNMPSFVDFDLDGNGVIIETEFNEAHAKRFSEMAADGHKMKNVKDAPGFSGIDSDDDGEINKEEFSAHQAEHHNKMHDGESTAEQ